MKLKFEDRVKAKPNTTAAIFADGRTGTIVETYQPAAGLGDNEGSQNLVRWDGDNILFGFYPDELEKVNN